ncbi:preprotein translocase subunit SecG [Halieaceae bacterium IMCC14734]|uniref:Protein-export membrane protein SecG n=1 Tax=Candidatus Litorirhabdus singularis TaxID=2518993 RepID=A0ABT3TMQ9_9GAMM|nr:preprotein translocase subunit SecG [Candidatus Litorirhabdus singularis]MCX2983045.1 preprotein translocase subunit SecG [Candidatus Litorirhabdus singularis]
MEQIVLVVHLLIALGIIGLIMLQQGKGADMGASFGAGASQTLFGSDGSGNVLTRATAFLAVAFFVSSFGLAMLAQDKADALSSDDLILPTVEAQMPADRDFDIPALDSDIPTTLSAPADDMPGIE